MTDNRSKVSTIAKLPNGLIITIFVPDLERMRELIHENNNVSLKELPAPQSLHYIVLLNELAKQISNFENNEITYIFTDSWRNCSLEYTDAFVILANKLQLDK